MENESPSRDTGLWYIMWKSDTGASSVFWSINDPDVYPHKYTVCLNIIINVIFHFFSEHILRISFNLDFILNNIRITESIRILHRPRVKIKSSFYIHISHWLRNLLSKPLRKWLVLIFDFDMERKHFTIRNGPWRSACWLPMNLLILCISCALPVKLLISVKNSSHNNKIYVGQILYVLQT